MKQNKQDQNLMPGSRAFSVIEALVGAAIIGMGLAAISGAINYSTSQHSKLKGATDSILAHTEVLKAVQAQNMQASQIISLCKKIKVRNSDGGGDLLDLSGQSVDDLKTPNFIKALDIGTGDCGNGSSCLYEVGQRVPPNFDVTVRQIVVEGNKDTSGEFVPDKSNLKIHVCEYPNNISDCKMGVGQEKIFEVYQLDLAVITSREKSDTSTGIGQNAQGEVEFKTAEEARIYTPLKIPMTIYTHSDKIVACSLSKVLHACERTVSGDLGAAGGALLVKGSLADPQELTCDLRASALQGLPQLGTSTGSYSDHFCISGPLYSVQKAGDGPYGCNVKVGNIAYNALVCEKGCGDTELVGEGFEPRQMLQWNHEGTGLKIFHCVKCLGPDGVPANPCPTGLECSATAQQEAYQEYRNCLSQAIDSNMNSMDCDYSNTDDADVNNLESCCSNSKDCRRAVKLCARRAGPGVAMLAGASWWRRSCPEFVEDEDGNPTTTPTPNRDAEDETCPVEPRELAYACAGKDSKGHTITNEEVAAATDADGSLVQPADAAAQQNTDSLPCDLLDRCKMIAGGDSIKASSVNYDSPLTLAATPSTNTRPGHFYNFICDYPNADPNAGSNADAQSCPAGGTKYRVPAVLLAERIPKSVLGTNFGLHEWNNQIEGGQIDGYYYSQAQNSPLKALSGNAFRTQAEWTRFSKKNKYYYKIFLPAEDDTEDSSSTETAPTIIVKTSPVPFPHDDVDANIRPHDYNSGETALGAINRRQNSYAYACWADRESLANGTTSNKWILDSWDERRTRLRDEGVSCNSPAPQPNNSGTLCSNSSDIRNVRIRRAGLWQRDPGGFSSAPYHGNFLYHDGLSLLKKIAGLYKTANDSIEPDIEEQDKVTVEMPGTLSNNPQDSGRQNDIRRAWLACATDELGFWTTGKNPNLDGVQKPTGLDASDACSEYVRFKVKVDQVCDACAPPNDHANCCSYSCPIKETGEGAGAVSSSIFAGIQHPQPQIASPSPTNQNCENNTSDMSFINPWLSPGTANGTGNYQNWKNAFINKLAAYMQRGKNGQGPTNGYWLGKDAKDQGSTVAHTLLEGNNEEVAKNFWKWFSLVHCDTYKYNQPVYRHRFACTGGIENSKLIIPDPDPNTNGALECCVKWAQKYNFGDRVDVNELGDVVGDTDHPTPQTGAFKIGSETYFIGPSNPDKCLQDNPSADANN